MYLTIKWCDHQTAQAFISWSFFVYFDASHCLLYQVKTQVIWSKLSKIFVCLTVFVFSTYCQLKREALCLQIWFWTFCQSFGSIADRQKKLLYYHCKPENVWLPENTRSGKWERWNFCLKFLRSETIHVCEDGIARKAHPFLLPASDSGATDGRPGWLWVPWISTAVFPLHFKWRNEGQMSCSLLRTEFIWV